MGQKLTLDLPDELARRAEAVARQTHRRVDDVLLEWLRNGARDVPVELLPDEQVLALRDLQMDPLAQDEMGDLLARQREGMLDEAGRRQLEEIMTIYRREMVRKAQALKVAVERGL
jgi:hypothetical protein